MLGAVVVLVIMHTTPTTPSTSKVRRDVIGGKRGAGRRLRQRVRRPDPRKIKTDETDAKLTSNAGLAMFGAFVRDLGVDDLLEREFGHLKSDPRVRYSMGAQMRALIDANVAGERRVLGMEALAADPLFVRLVGGSVPSIDTFYRDLRRCDATTNAKLEEVMVEQGMTGHGIEQHKDLHLDLDTHVNSVFGTHEGAVPGYNPRYHGRPCLHPIAARIAETDTCVGALLRPGDTTFGADDAAFVRRTIRRVVARLQREQLLFVRMDAAADCAAILRVFQDERVYYVVKARVTEDMSYQTFVHANWTTVDTDADGEPVTQVAEIPFIRMSWVQHGVRPRVIALRSREPGAGRQMTLWEGLDWSVKLYLTNSPEAPQDVAARYEGRAGIEPLIAEWKNGWGMDNVPCFGFQANHAALLLKMLSHNLMRRFVRAVSPELVKWRIAWVRRALINVAGQLVRSGRRWFVRVMRKSKLLEVARRRE